MLRNTHKERFSIIIEKGDNSGTWDRSERVWDVSSVQKSGYEVSVCPPIGGKAVGRNVAWPLPDGRHPNPALL